MIIFPEEIGKQKSIRYGLAHVLGEIGGIEAKKSLNALLSDESSDVREKAKRTLDKLEGKESE